MNKKLIIIIAIAVFLLGGSAVALDAFYQYDEMFKRAGLKYAIPWRWLKAIAMNESSLGKDWRVRLGQVSSDGKSYGLMQVTLATGEDLDPDVTAEKLNDPEYSVNLAAKYLKQLALMFNGDRESIVMSYNQGPGNTRNGKTYAAEYYARFQRNLAQVLEKQPGNEMELS